MRFQQDEMNRNKLRYMLDNKIPTMGTRISSTWPLITEALGTTGMFDYVEYLAEYAPFNQVDLENLARVCEQYDMACEIKLDFQDKAYVSQKAMASGFQGILFTDHKTPEEVKESIFVTTADTPAEPGRLGYPGRRWIGYNYDKRQLSYAKMVKDTVRMFMIEKVQAVENIEAICQIPGVDVVQWGPSDYSLSRGWNMVEHLDELKEIERHIIKVAQKYGVHARAEINSPEEAEYYLKLGVIDFCMGAELRNNMQFWTNEGKKLRDILAEVK